ncbi:MAG: acyl-CoA transferase [Pseudooceanicola sp.]|nr:acyl-CoA transferase [Pseudooceanicola sp.]
MPSKSEQVLTALLAVLEGVSGPDVERNTGLPETVPPGGLVVLHDGDPGEPEVLLSPLTYLYEHEAELDVFVQAAASDSAFDALKVAIGVAIAADRTLGGLCDWVEAVAPVPSDLPFVGAVALKAATIGVRLTYSTSDPLA